MHRYKRAAWRRDGVRVRDISVRVTRCIGSIHALTYRSRRRRRALRSWNDTKTGLMFAARYLQRNSRLLTRVPYTDSLVFDKTFVAQTRENPRTTAIIMPGVSGNRILYSRVRIEN